MQPILTLEEPSIRQNIVNYTPHVIDNNSNMNHVYQNTTIKLQPPKNNWITPRLLGA